MTRAKSVKTRVTSSVIPVTPRMRTALYNLVHTASPGRSIGRPTRQRLVKAGLARWMGPLNKEGRPVTDYTWNHLNWDQDIEITDLGRRIVSGVKSALARVAIRALDPVPADPPAVPKGPSPQPLTPIPEGESLVAIVPIDPHAACPPTWAEGIRSMEFRAPPPSVPAPVPNLNGAAALLNRLQDHLSIGGTGESVALDLLRELRAALFGDEP